jgi:uncharacterized protein (TIGR02466 family)|tara:strand:+ start:1363 stop:2007 length:645 start_codon:yes stop_codon:yes gene_type:complete
MDKYNKFFEAKPDDNSLLINRNALFPTMIWTADLPEREVQNEKLLKDILDLRETSDGIVRSNQLTSWHSDVNLHTLPEFSRFTHFIWLCAEGVFKDSGYSFKPSITTMWGNVNPQNSFNKCHLHPDSIISGVYYVKIPENMEGSGKLRFYNPNIHSRMQTSCYDQWPMWEQPEIVYTPSERKLVMFPSDILHEVEPNLSDEYRVSIAFNCSFNV